LETVRGEELSLTVEESDASRHRLCDPDRITDNAESAYVLELARSRPPSADSPEYGTVRRVDANLAGSILEYEEVPFRVDLHTSDLGEPDGWIIDVADFTA